jgi:hypothetical protein
MRPPLILFALPLAACMGGGRTVPVRHPASPSADATPLPAVAAALTREDDASSAAPTHHHHHHAMPDHAMPDHASHGGTSGGAAHE